MLGLLLADECNRKIIKYMFTDIPSVVIGRYVAKTQPRSIRLTCQQRCVSPESSNVTLLTATTRRGRVSAHCPSFSVSSSPLPLYPPSSFFCLCLFFSPLRHFDAPVIPPALHAPRVQLALQTPCSQHTMHNPAPVMQTT